MKKKGFTHAPVHEPLTSFGFGTVRGFTFIELLVAITIFSIIATSIYATLHTGIKVWSRINSALAHNQKVRLCFNEISSDIGNAVSYSGFEPEWTSEKIAFPALVDISDGGTVYSQIARVSFFLDGSTGRLKSARALKQDGFDAQYAEERILLDGVESVEFAYPYLPASPDQEYEWRAVWTVEKIIPRGVNVKVKMKKSELFGEEAFETKVFIPIGEIGPKD